MTPLKLISCVLHSCFSIPLPHQCSCWVSPRITFGKGAFGVFSTIPIWISCRVDSFKAYPRSRFCSCTQRQTQKTQKYDHKNEGFPYKSEEMYMVQQITSHWFTWSPQGDALLLMSLADAVVAVAFHVVAGVPIMQINVGRAVRVGTSTELWQVTGVTGLSTQGASQFQL